MLGLGNIGALAAKPVMEGKSALLKKFAQVDSFDICVATENIDEFIQTVKNIAPSFGAINLEDIKAPDCFIIEEKLQDLVDIPIFHDDQHGTAITLAAALINALEIQQKEMKEIKIVINGAGASAIASANLLLQMGVKTEQIKMFDRTGLIHEGRKDLNTWKKAFACKTSKEETLEEALTNVDVFIGLSAGNVLDESMVEKMNKDPIIFAMANPVPEILPEKVYNVSPNAIVATGRSDYPNQVNNLITFPYIFRGLLDLKVKKVTPQMKVEIAKAIANVAKKPVSEKVQSIYSNKNLKYGRQYILPTPFDENLISEIYTAIEKTL